MVTVRSFFGAMVEGTRRPQVRQSALVSEPWQPVPLEW